MTEKVTYDVHPTNDGAFVVTRMMPVQVGQFEFEDGARFCAEMMEQRDQDDETPPPAAPIPRSIDAPAPAPVEAKPETIVAAKPEPAPVLETAAEPEATPPAEEEPEPDWPAMFAKIENGGTVSGVAAYFDVPMPKLRGQWAAYQKHKQKADVLSDEQVHCSVCEKPIVPGQDGSDMCARCKRA